MAKPNLIYIGSPEFSAQILEHLLTTGIVNVVGVVTQPDKPQGRKQLIVPSPVAQMAANYDLPVFKPAKLDEANLSHLKLLKPDIFLVVSYGKIIPQSWLDLPTIGTFNIHFSLLPKYRGALCISEAIKNQDVETGVTLMVMDCQLDHGPIVAQEKISIDLDDNTATLTTKLTRLAIQLLDNKLPEICAKTYTYTAQDENLVTFTPSHRSLTRESAFIPWEKLRYSMNEKGAETHALIRSLNPEPGAWTTIKDKDLKILKSSLVENKLKIEQVQMSGKNPISWKQFCSGYLNE